MSKRPPRRGPYAAARRSERLPEGPGPRDLLADLGRPILSEIEDRRFFNPDIYSPLRISNVVARVTSLPNVNRKKTSRFITVVPYPARPNKIYSLGFKDPSGVILCVRRKIRKEIIHARGIAGSKVRKPRFNEFSRVRCK